MANVENQPIDHQREHELPSLQAREVTIFEEAPSRSSERFATQETPLKGIRLRMEPAIDKIRMNLSEIRQFKDKAVSYALRHRRILDNQAEEKIEREEVIAIVEGNEGLRGIEIDEVNVVLTAVPREGKPEYNPDKLEEDLGEYLDQVVKKQIEITVNIPELYTTADGRVIDGEMVTNKVMEVVWNMGFQGKELSQVMDVEIKTQIDEEMLAKLQAEGKVRLSAGTRIAKRNWAIIPDVLRKPAPDIKQ